MSIADYTNSGNLIPDYATTAVCAGGISMDCESSSIRHAWMPCYLLYGYETSSSGA